MGRGQSKIADGDADQVANDAPATNSSNPELAKYVSPLNQRKCTDLCWVAIFMIGWLAYFVVTIMGVSVGNPNKLFKPRDYQGAYCGIADNWNDGPDLAAVEKQSYMMNVSSSVEQIAKQLLCSGPTAGFLMGTQSPLTASEKSAYSCGCCLSPCDNCQGGLELGKGGNLKTNSQLSSTIAGRMNELTSFSSGGGDFFNPAGFNGEFAATMWSKADEFFVKVCLPDCKTDYTSLLKGSRNYTYKPSADTPLRVPWEKLIASTNPIAGPMKNSILTDFTFQALPPSICPYPSVYCVPFPGITFSDFAGDFCMFEMAAAVKDAVGGVAADAFTALGGSAFASGSTETFGTWMGDFEKSIDSFVLTGLCAFVVGLVFLVLLRFCVGACVWMAIFGVLFFLMVMGGIVFVRSGQCSNAGLFDSGRQMAVAVTVAGATRVTTAASGNTARSEELIGDGSSYVGVMTRTVNGYACKPWDETDSRYWPVLQAKGNLESNFCRNPYNASSLASERSTTIWCFTVSEEKNWEVCNPVGVIQPECHGGYAVEGEYSRIALKVVAVIFWVLALIWVIVVLCFWSRISLAIKLNQVAATFVGHCAEVLIIPMVQAVLAILWSLIWFASACFLISQVPDTYTPKLSFSSYLEAYGTEDNPGKCTDRWPTGFVWKDETCSGANPQCWRCAPPRFIFDVRFFISFFMYLWNNAFLLALGQCCIAGAVGVWFFTPNTDKGKVKTVRHSVVNAFRFHIGSLAFGSFILAVVQFIKYLLMYLERQAEAQKNRIVQMILKCLSYLIMCLERFIKFLTKNAYIQVALRGTPFCTSAKKAFDIIGANFLRFGVVATLGRVVHAIGYVFITSVSTIIGYFILKGMHPEASPVIPVFVYFMTSLIVGRLYMSVFGLAVDTCLQCVIQAEEMDHDGRFVPSQLKKVLKAKVKSDPGQDDS